MELPLIILLLVVLTFTNAFFAASMTAIEFANKNKLKLLVSEGQKNASDVLKYQNETSDFLPTIQFGIILSGFFSSAVAARYLVDDISKELANVDFIAHSISSALAFVIVTFVLSFFTVVFGVLVPRRIGLKHSEKIAFGTIGVVKFFMVFFKPSVKLLRMTTNLVLRLFKINPNEEIEKVSEEEIISMIESGTEHGTINEEESEMISSIFEFNDITAQEIMTPRTEVYMIDINEFSEDTIDEMINENYSRVPVYNDSPDDIVGIIYIKNVLREARSVGFDQVKLENIMSKPYFIPSRKKINEVFRELQASKNYMAILVDEYGGFQGIVTIEDLIEEIFGDIYDEYDEEETDVRQVEPNKYVINGLISIEELNEELNLDIPIHDDYDTIAGYILSHIGYIPEKEDKIVVKYQNLTFEVIQMDEKRIDEIMLTIDEIANEATEDETEI
ncbi:CBS/transporter-associated domain protein [Paracholeplasma brassicae]|jgi:putative hemolysin|uniref:CBS/transporter-associated domain protein n=1 Tax=Acholeplasma brassicae TaxID=61635 RepID=U4KMH8_9MOLU|nr:hemolysin family protein [Paracholeplasma brassicae]CCV65357.1 CBS/transporter-associated domain protein [Paracholeplasma brassicae]